MAPYWVLTSNDWLLKNALINSNDETHALLGNLMQEKSIVGSINANLRYEDLMEDPDTLWTLLLFCGYLTFESKAQDDLQLSCQLKIPNREVLAQYKAIYTKRHTRPHGHYFGV